MAKKTIMLVCSAGMSTSLLVTKMQKAAEDRGMKGQFEQKLQPKGIPLDVINMADYGMMNGEKVLDQAISLMGSSN
ncbi:MAG: hypothetical protein E7B55_09145 [Enterococcus faecalis]|nr:hypothetical protein [Enterococcus faecalis]